MVVVYTVEEAAQVLKISRWKIFDLIRTNQLARSRSVACGASRVPLSRNTSPDC